jgi:8-oxo-dGTP pyrophosphatase MutT (NUDIX family)
MPKTTLQSRTIAAGNKWTSVVEEKFSFDDGRQGQYLIVERPTAVGMLPLLKQGDKYYTYMVRQYRYPIDKEVWQFPMGSLDEGKELVEHARDELRQETGLIAEKVTKLREYFLDPGLSRQRSVFFVAEGVQEGGKQELDEEEEGLTYKKIPLEDLNGMITDGTITDFWGYVGIRLLQDYVSKHSSSSS